MKEDRFMELRKHLDKYCEDILTTKGMAYSGKEDKLGNFKRLSTMVRLTPVEVWFVYFMKHVDAVASYVREEYKDSESIEGRIADIRNYADLLYAIVNEEEDEDGV